MPIINYQSFGRIDKKTSKLIIKVWELNGYFIKKALMFIFESVLKEK